MAVVDRVLVLNAGSSSLKASVLGPSATDALASAALDWDAAASPDVDAALRDVFAAIERDGIPIGSLDAVGHRVVHGGTRFAGPARIDDAVLAAIDALRELAPLHNPVAARVIAAARRALPRLPHVAAFDTAFHTTLPASAYVYALPYAWHADWGIRRFGFHGLSVAWAVERAASLLRRAADRLDLVVAHLGSGCSVTAVHAGASADTSMGMTPLEGLVMGTRAGSIDPGILLDVQLRHGLDAKALADTLEHRSGLLGLGGTADMRALLRAAPSDPRAALAVDVFVRRAAAGIAAAATTLPRLDAVVFTGGIGEHAAGVRRDIVARLATCGVSPIGAEDVATDGVLGGGAVAVLRVEAREDVSVARQTQSALA